MNTFVEHLLQLSANLYIPESEMKQEQLEARPTHQAAHQPELGGASRKLNVSSGEDAFYN